MGDSGSACNRELWDKKHRLESNVREQSERVTRVIISVSSGDEQALSENVAPSPLTAYRVQKIQNGVYGKNIW